MNIPICTVNEALTRDAEAYIAAADTAYDQKLTAVADYIYAHREQSPIILLSGPSGSGKTTTAQLIEHKLDARGCETHTLSMDDYFHSLTDEQRQLAADNRLDLEAPDRVDTALLGEQLSRFIAGEPIAIPAFDFATSTRVASTRTLTRKPNELLILEGIHALNPAVITLPETQTVRLYVSVQSRIVSMQDNPLHTMEIRLLRRLLRDYRCRGRQPQDTLRMFRSVQSGEDKYIRPYKHRSTFDIDTFHAYEVNVYKPLAMPLLLPLADQPEIAELLPILDELVALGENRVPAKSLIREFIG